MYIRGLIYVSVTCLVIGRAEAQVLSVTTESFNSSQTYALNPDNLVASNVTDAPIVQNNQIIGQTQNSSGSVGWDPYGSSGVASGSQWLSVGGASAAQNASVTYTIPGTDTGAKELSLVWGSASATNEVTLLENNTVVGQVNADGNGNLLVGNEVVASGLVNSFVPGMVVNITTGSVFNRVVFSEGTNQGGFEIGNVSVNPTVGSANPAPLPPLGASPLGLFVLAFAAFMRREHLAGLAGAAMVRVAG